MSSLGADFNWLDYAEDCKLLMPLDSQQSWVFGVRWLPTMGAKSRHLLLRQLRRERVRWWLSSKHVAGTIGFLPPHPDAPVAREESGMYCAAMMFALSHPIGTHILNVAFMPDLYWLVAVNDGSVISQTDCLLKSPVLAQELQTSLCRRYVHATVTEVVIDEAQSVFEVLPFLEDRALQTQAVFKRLRVTQAPWRWLSVSVVLLGGAAWWMLAAPATDSKRMSERDAIASVAAELSISTGETLSTLTALWSTLPAQHAGWQLLTVHCQIQVNRGQCRARYQRQALDATNQGLECLLAQDWSMHPVTLNETDFLRTLRVPAKTVSQVEVKDMPMGAEQRPSYAQAPAWMHALQQLSALTDSIDLGERVAVAESIPNLAVYALRIRLPLGDIQRVMSLNLPVAWKLVQLDLLAASRYSGGMSRLSVLLEGDLYAAL